MVVKQQWPRKNLILGTILFIVGIILYASKFNSKNEHGAQSLRRTSYVLMGIGCINILIGLIYYIVYSCSNNQPRHSNPTNTTQIEPSIHVIAVQEPVVEVRRTYSHDDPPPSYEEAIKSNPYSSGQFLNVPVPNVDNYNVRSNSFSNHQVLSSRSPIK